MLKLMRKHAKFFYVLFVLVILSFIFWGVGTVDKQTTVPLAEVGEETVGLEDYWRAYDRMAGLYREVYKDKFDSELQEQLRQKVLDSLIDEKVLLIAASESGITVSEKEIEDAIMNDESFIRDGTFSKEIYLRVLELNRMTPLYYEAAKRRELMLEKMRRLIEESVDLTVLDLKGISGDEKQVESIKQSLLEAKRQAAVTSFVEGLKRRVVITVNRDLIS